MAEASTAVWLARRWLQFRLRTLLLIPFLLLLLQVLSDQLFDHLIWLWSAYGAFFGAVWAIGRMRIVGLRCTGLHRVLPVAQAAVGGGMIGGAMMGPLVFWTALWRNNSWRFFNTRGVADDVWELFTSGVASYWCGGLCGALAGGACGTIAAYLACFAVRSFGTNDWCATAAGKNATAEAITPIRNRGPRFSPALAVLLAVGPPVWVAWCLWGDWTEQRIIGRLRRHGLTAQYREVYGPQWFANAIAPGYELTWFRRGGDLFFSGNIDNDSFRELDNLKNVRMINFAILTDRDLIAATNWLRRHPKTQASFTLGSRHINKRGIASLDGPRISEKGIASLQGLTNVVALNVVWTPLSEKSIQVIQSLSSMKQSVFVGVQRQVTNGTTPLSVFEQKKGQRRFPFTPRSSGGRIGD